MNLTVYIMKYIQRTIKEDKANKNEDGNKLSPGLRLILLVSYKAPMFACPPR